MDSVCREPVSLSEMQVIQMDGRKEVKDDHES